MKLIAWCSEKEIDWVNDQYRSIDFKPSNLKTDRVAIAMIGQERAGLGRLCAIGKGVFELGGMHVQPAFRGRGIARQIVRFLLDSLQSGDRVYCLPFKHLRDFYCSEGFREATKDEENAAPDSVVEKHRWCNATYSYEVLMLLTDVHK